MNIKLEKEAQRKKISRDIVDEIINFGVTESQKFDIMFNLALTLENNSAIKEIANILKKYKTNINNDTEDNNIVEGNKIILQ